MQADNETPAPSYNYAQAKDEADMRAVAMQDMADEAYADYRILCREGWTWRRALTMIEERHGRDLRRMVERRVRSK